MKRADKLKLLAINPHILEELLSEIPEEILKLRRIKAKWSIHEHACHLAEAQKMMLERFQTFKTVKNPVFQPYLPGTSDTPDDHLLKLDLHKSLKQFMIDRVTMVNYLETFLEHDWQNEGLHPEFKKFNADIFTSPYHHA